MQKRKDRIIIISVYLLYIILIYILSRNLQTTQHIYYDLLTQNPFLRYQSSSQLSFCNRPILCKKVESFFMDWVLCHNKYKQSIDAKVGVVRGILNMMQIVISNKSPAIKINAMEAPLTYFKIISQHFKLAIPMLRVRITTSLNDIITN